MSQAPSAPPPATSSRPGQTIGSELAGNSVIQSGIQQIVREIQARSAKLTGERGPIDSLRVGYDEYLKRAADTRGRGLLYPYLGSGIGNGALVELLDGSVKWDLICGIGVHFFGHSEPDLISAGIEGTISDTFQNGNLQSGYDAYEFAETFLAEARKCSRLRYAYCATSGCMANENAIKVCYQKNAPAARVIAFKDCFMGRSVTMCQIGDTAGYRQGIPLSTLVDYMPFYNEAAARDMGQARYIDAAVAQLRQYIERYPRQHAAFIFELIQGEGGFNTAPREYFAALMDVCKENKIAVWDDEIQSFGRTEKMFAFDRQNLGDYIDVFTVGKMTQVCAVAFTEDYNPGPGLLSGTFTSSPTAFKVGKRVIERLRDGDYYGENGLFARHHKLFSEQVHALAARHPEWFPANREITDIVGGSGGMMRFTPFGGKKDLINKACKHLFDEGAIVFYCGHGPYHIRMLPPLPVLNEADWPRIFQVLERGLAKTAAEG
ncbi:MAG: aminotransferase class III-fold pyridoxal phosphate-dependent enzyme [Pyrinomonadaceae bacterium]|nr:aminotransferase class III-fold pyridoxal phosphate-dependent enzyme [Phycisphaerales bacterium]